MSGEQDQYISEVFQDRDTRSEGRRIRVLELHPIQDRRAGRWPEYTTYRAIRVDALGDAIGKQRVRVTRRTLDTHYRKVSH